MSQQINTYELSDTQQDVLWSDTCPYCSGDITESSKTVDDAYWVCSRCDVRFICQ